MGWFEIQCTRYVVAASLFAWLVSTSRLTSSASLRPRASRLPRATTNPSLRGTYPAVSCSVCFAFRSGEKVRGEEGRQIGGRRHEALGAIMAVGVASAKSIPLVTFAREQQLAGMSAFDAYRQRVCLLKHACVVPNRRP